MLKIADRLGRGYGRLRLLDHLNPPPPAQITPDLDQFLKSDLAVIWVGHATCLIRIGGMTILTDPVFSSRVGIGLGMLTGGPRRFIAPALTIKKLPPIDLILISHAHFDHLDRPSLSRLPKRIPVITAHHTRDLLDDLGFRSVQELKWGESTSLGPLKVSAHSVKHWGARTFFDRHRGFNAYVLESGTRRALYGGDTAYHEGFKDIGNVDLAIIGIAAYDPYIQAHATPEQAWQMALHAGAAHLLPMHHSTFRLSHEPMREPLERLLVAAGSEAKRVIIRDIGGAWSV